MSQGKFVSKSHGNNVRLCPDSRRKPGWKMIVRLYRMSHAVKYQGKIVNKSHRVTNYVNEQVCEQVPEEKCRDETKSYTTYKTEQECKQVPVQVCTQQKHY